jgi:hypothetical protein
VATEVAARSPSHPSLLTSGAAPAYERHQPEETALYTVVCEQLETFLARAREGDRPAPRFIEQELRAYLVDSVLTEVLIRQWVLTLPYPPRYRCAYDAALTSDILRVFLRALFSALRRRAKSQWDTPRGQCGSVTFIQRFGSALNLNLHFPPPVLADRLRDLLTK